MTEKYPILAIDYGERNFGLAISDSKGILASPLKVISITKNRNVNQIIKEILETCEEYMVQRILLGKPQEFTEEHKRTTKRIDSFLRKLKSFTKIPIVTHDEAFSTTEALNVLTSSGQNIQNSKQKIDKIAATIFLQEFLNSKK